MADRRFSRARGVALAPLADAWAGHSALANASHLLNDESAAILLMLSEDKALSASTVCAGLAAEWDEPAATIEQLVSPIWDDLLAAGLVIEHTGAAGN